MYEQAEFFLRKIELGIHGPGSRDTHVRPYPRTSTSVMMMADVTSDPGPLKRSRRCKEQKELTYTGSTMMARAPTAYSSSLQQRHLD
jgi:hypothetical protein